MARLATRVEREGSPAESGQIADSLTIRTDAMRMLLSSDMAVLLAITRTGAFEVVAAAGAPPLPPAGSSVSGGIDSLCGYAAQHRAAVIFDNVAATARFRGAEMATRFGAVSSLVVALRHQDAVVGVLSVHSRAARLYTPHEAQTLEHAIDGLASQLAAARRSPESEAGPR